MGIESLLQQNMQNAGLAGTDRLARNAMFPQAQMDKTQYAVSSQLPTSAGIIRSDYDTPSDAYTGTTQPFAAGGITSIPRYDGEDGSVVTDENGAVVVAPNDDPTLGNPDFANLSYMQLQDPDKLKAVNALKTTDPKAYNAQLMGMLSDSIKEQYNTNADYEKSWWQLEGLKDTDPAAWHRAQLDFLGHQQGWQIGQNTSERNAAGLPAIENAMAQARAAGLSDQEIQQILANSQQSGNYENQRRIINAQQNAGSGIGEGIKTVAPLALMAVAPELALLMPELGAIGTGALMGGALGGVSAGISGGDVGKGILMGGATGAAGGAMSGLDPNIAQGLNTAKNVYGVAQSGGKNLNADINAFKGIANMAPTTAAHGGLMASGGITTLGSYSDGGRLLKGPGDGMSDNIPASISGKQPARLADGEFVIPADVVSHLGNGSTDAGAKQLYKMMDRIRHARTGNKKQGKRINPNKYLPKG